MVDLFPDSPHRWNYFIDIFMCTLLIVMNLLKL